VPSQIMRLQIDSHNFPCLFDQHSRRRIGNREDPLVWLNPVLPDKCFQAMGQFLRDEGNLSLTTALGRLDDNPPPFNVTGPQVENFADSHPPSGHQFQDEPVSLIRSSENDFVHGFLFNNLPGNGLLVFEGFPEERRFARVHELLIAGVYDEAEEGAKKREAESLGGLPCSFGEAAQEGKDLFRGQGFSFSVTELGGKPCKKVFIVSDRVFFSSSSCGSL
jgi:hypothetical protein